MINFNIAQVSKPIPIKRKSSKQKNKTQVQTPLRPNSIDSDFNKAVELVMSPFTNSIIKSKLEKQSLKPLDLTN